MRGQIVGRFTRPGSGARWSRSTGSSSAAAAATSRRASSSNSRRSGSVSPRPRKRSTRYSEPLAPVFALPFWYWKTTFLAPSATSVA